MKMNLPNRLTVFRILLIPVFIVLYFVEFEGHRLAAALVYLVACFTDFFDGYLARKHNLVTNFGKFIDPIADKMLIACSLIRGVRYRAHSRAVVRLYDSNSRVHHAHSFARAYDKRIPHRCGG